MTAPPNPLTALAERVEKLTEPCRETDLAIELVIRADGKIASLMQFPRGFDGREGTSWQIYQGAVCYETRNEQGACYSNGGYPLPAFTASLDAAMTLVPEGDDFYFEVEQVMGGFCNYLYVTGGGSMALSHDLRGKGGKLHPSWKEAVAALPREISATALRARAALESSHG